MLASGELLGAGHVGLSAGVYGSPAILMRSGIGPADEPTSLGIDVVADVPGVGAHLAEQPFFVAVFAADPAELTERTPPLQTMLTVAEPGSAARPWLHVFPTTFAPGEMSPTGVAFEINVGLLKPRSRGRVTLVSPDRRVPPRIDVNLLDDPRDVASMVEGIPFARRLVRTEPLASLHEGEVFPGDAVSDDADTLTPILKAGVSFYNHANGTVRMGPRKRSAGRRGRDRCRARRFQPERGRCVDHADATIQRHDADNHGDRREGRARFAHAALRRSRRRAGGRHRCCLIRTAEPSFGSAQSHRPIERVITCPKPPLITNCHSP